MGQSRRDVYSINASFSARLAAIDELCAECARTTFGCKGCREAAGVRRDAKRRARTAERQEVRFVKENGFSL